MSDHAKVWHAARDLAFQGSGAGLATIARHRGSLPMATDAKMLVTTEGHRVGTVGGGCVEADVTAQTLGVARAGGPALVSHTLTADAAGDLGLSCGGTAQFFLEPLVATPDMAALYGAIGDAIRDRARVVVYTPADWASGPRKAADINGRLISVGRVDPPTPRPGDVDGVDAVTYLDPRGEVFVERVERIPRVVIFGAGHVGREIARVAAATGFYVVIIDDRAEFANADRVPWAHQVIAEDFRTVLDTMSFDADDYVLATTRGHSFDAHIVERAAPSAARYVGMLGSARKREVIWRALEGAGVPRDALARVRVPIGEAIGADTPAEIAVSAVAELVKVRRLGNSRQ